MSLSLYNKYRPQTFVDVVGQEHVEKTLANAVATASIFPAYLFCGPRGTGKTTTARILAKALLCVHAPTPTPDGTCEQCREISEGVHPDVYELDAASRTGVDNVREEIIGRVHFAPTHGAYKIYIIDEVHMLSTAAFNALLKTLEEPPKHVVFVLCTTDANKVPKTVQSRCQRFDFHRLSASEIAERLRYICRTEQFTAEDSALELIAQRSQGGMRDAISALEQIAVYGGGEVSYRAAESLLGEINAGQLFSLCNLIAANNAPDCFEWVAGFVQGGSDIAILVNDLAAHVRNLYVMAVSGALDEPELPGEDNANSNSDRLLAQALDIEPDAFNRFKQQARAFGSVDRLAYVLTLLGDLATGLKDAANARLALEIALTKMLRPNSSLTLEALAVRLERLERELVANASSLVFDTGVDTIHPTSRTNGVSTADGADSTDAPSTDVPSTDVPSTDANRTTGSPANSQQSRDILRLWDQVIDSLKAQRPGVAANLGGSIPHVDTTAQTLTVELPSTASMSKTALEKPNTHELITSVVHDIFKDTAEIKVVNFSLGDQPAASPGAPNIEPASERVFSPESAGGQSFSAEPPNEQFVFPEPALASESKPALEPTASSEPSVEEPALFPETASIPEPSKDDLEDIISASLNSKIRFEEA
ncbi:MAG: DNA polymerase III subunit gamma/tau [Coriobacteriales bacterium]|jgi:DNA polymerase-3 subunit gamma/tau|nr:DNA polymerase III subunit gamma/tau [Coriobacteriales bacterium]